MKIMEFYKTNKFKKDFRRMKKRGADLSKLTAVLQFLINQQPLPPVYRDHLILSGECKNIHDAHISPDWILLYEIQDEVIVLHRTGSHSDLNF